MSPIPLLTSAYLASGALLYQAHLLPRFVVEERSDHYVKQTVSQPMMSSPRRMARSRSPFLCKDVRN